MDINLVDLQKRVLQNKINHGFNTTDLKFEILLLYSEVNELFKGWLKKDTENMAEELADIMIYVLGIAEMLEVDLSEKLLEKMDINERRVYHKDGSKTVKD
ncbi:hypothetical protein JXA27_05775 [Aerococcaceae bacterium zg-B36]|uniref:MazG-like family protein n=1 Tax=Aerococcaceae bacterium zg-252 TaxID=2796928 RepID=UPI001BD8C0B9|nr:hypothetical protein [Aerococcaceae bacterium zg-B36]